MYDCDISYKHKMATSIKNCPICLDEVQDSRVLPCIHSLCLKCLEDYCRSKNKLPGDNIPCPECRNEFHIPKTGVAGLTARTHDKEAVPSATCEACSYELHGTPSTSYCIDCDQKLCERCSIPHLKWRGGPHDVKTLDALSPKHMIGGYYCGKHKERVKIYCLDCESSMCSMCCLESHKLHKFEQINIMMEEFDRNIDQEMKLIMNHIENFRGVDAQFEAQSDNLFSSIQAIEHKIKNKGEKMKQSLPHLIDLQVGELLHKLQSMKSAAEKEVKLQKDAMQLAQTEMENFRTSSLELKLKVSPGDIKQTCSDVHVRAKELLQKHVIPGEYHAPSYKFTPINIEDLVRDERNFIGNVTKVENPGSVCSYKFCVCYLRF